MQISATTVIQATPEQVWSYITVPENGPQWQEAAVWTRVTTPGPVGIGTRMEHMGRWLRMRIPTVAVVTEYERPSVYGYEISSKVSPKPAPMRYVLEPVANGTRLTLSNAAPLSLLMKPFERVLTRSVQGMFERDVARLKERVEAQVNGDPR